MKTRCFDHIDLRVKDMEVAKKFYGQFLPQLGFVRERHEPSPRPEAGGDFHTFILLAPTSRLSSSDLPRTGIISRTERASHSGPIPERKSIGLPNWYGKPAEKIWKVQKPVSITARAITRSSSRTLTGTNWKFAAGKVRSLPLRKTTRQLIACRIFVV
jgi:hypothetical protein